MIDRERADRWCGHIIFGLVLALLAFAPLALGAVRGFPLAIVQSLTVTAAIVWLIRISLVSEKRFFWPPLCWAVLAFLLYGFFQYWRSDVEFTARQELIKISVYALLFFTVIHNVAVNHFQRLAIGLVIVAAAISGYAMYQYGSGSQQIWQFTKPAMYAYRAGGTFVNPNHLAGFLGMILPLGLALVVFGRLNYVAKIFLSYACLMCVGGIVVTLSRGGWLACGISLAVFCVTFLVRSRYRLQVAAVMALVVVIAAAFYINSFRFQTRVARTFDERGNVEDLRLHLWRAAIGMWKSDPLVGVGPGHFDHRYAEYRGTDWKTQRRPGNAHSEYLNALAEWGAIGVIILSAAAALLLVGAWKTRVALASADSDLGRKKSNREAVLYGALIGLLFLFLHSVVEFNLQVPSNAIVAVVLIGMVTSLRRYEPQTLSYSLRVPLKLLISLGVLALCSHVAFEATKKFRESRWLALASKSPANSSERLAALKMAHEAEPMNFDTTYAIGELLRNQSFGGNSGYEALAREAMNWYHKGMNLNRYFPHNFTRYGMCLDWLGEHAKALAFFEKAQRLDPHNYTTANYMGWHYMQVEDYDAAKLWFDRSLELNNNYMNRNPMPETYLKMIERRRAEASQPPTELSIPPKP